MATYEQLLDKYNIPVPRYTSYPTVPNWKEQIPVADWMATFRTNYAGYGSKGISLYIHLPFCESLCTYCGCNKKITTNHQVEDEYITTIHKEWATYLQLMGEQPVLRELHLGGGTPTFFSPANLERLLQPIFNSVTLHDEKEFSFEGHPNNTTRQHLETLYQLGFRRVSFGVQDNDPEVQRIINRIQPFSNVQRVTSEAREIGYQSVNFDLIYGLPRQNIEGMRKTIADVTAVRPDRVAFYSYAHVPWTSRGQRLFDENDLPDPAYKLQLFRTGREIFLNSGYTDIGMDHFALPHDELNTARNEGRLHRNFMGYTTQQTEILIGLGVSAISAIPEAFAQNDKTLHNYSELTAAGTLPVQKGYFLTETDRVFGGYIRDIACKGSVTYREQDQQLIHDMCTPALEQLKNDGLIHFNHEGMNVTETGKSFIRNACSALDLYLAGKKEPGAKQFSKGI
jgi:oxygen-independent coproporphyrinogen-3 oxidase